jgi:ElaB/YqjD/DUF883 family membrane-anchored ribosome-binding protein
MDSTTVPFTPFPRPDASAWPAFCGTFPRPISLQLLAGRLTSEPLGSPEIFITTGTGNKIHFSRRKKMSEFDEEVKKAEKELNQGLIPVKDEFGSGDDEFLGDIKMQAQEYGARLQDAAMKARDFASEKFAVASDKFKELQDKDPKELVEEAKEYARQKPGNAILISAAAGLILGLLLRRK